MFGQRDTVSATMTPIVKNSTINFNILPQDISTDNQKEKEKTIYDLDAVYGDQVLWTIIGENKLKIKIYAIFEKNKLKVTF